jgi:hypothetical protein
MVSSLKRAVPINWKKSPAALFRTVASLPPAKDATFAGYVVRVGIHV